MVGGMGSMVFSTLQELKKKGIRMTSIVVYNFSIQSPPQGEFIKY